MLTFVKSQLEEIAKRKGIEKHYDVWSLFIELPWFIL